MQGTFVKKQGISGKRVEIVSTNKWEIYRFAKALLPKVWALSNDKYFMENYVNTRVIHERGNVIFA